MEVTIEPANPADFDPVGRVFAEENRFHAELLPELFQVAEPIMTPEWFEAVLSNPGQALLVARVDGQVVGALLLQEMTNPDDSIYRPRRYLYVDELVVAHALRCRGIGRALMDAAANWALERGIEEIELNVWERNLGAIAFYQHLGYTTVRRRLRQNLGFPKFGKTSEVLIETEGDSE
ncbi:MAG: GNAT family N-acetyltransferase [Anaerolineae bacterium]